MRAHERVEGVEELLLELRLAGDELHVIQEQHIDLAVTFAERGHGVVLDCVDVLVEEGF